MPIYTSRDTHKTRKPLFPQLETTKPQKLKIEGKNIPKNSNFLKSPVSRIVLRLFTGVVLKVVAFVFMGVDVLGKTFSGSESEFSRFWGVTGFFDNRGINIFWFSAKILVRSDIISDTF